MGRMCSAARLSLVVTLAALTLNSCVTGIEEPSPGPQYVDISIRIPDQKESPIVTTRHGTEVSGEGDENVITTLAFLVFKNDNSFELYKSLTINPSDNSSGDPMWNPTTSSYRLLLTVGTKNIYAVANWPLNGTLEMPSLGSIQTISVLNAHLRNHSGNFPGIPPVMTGYIQRQLQGGEQGIEIELTRQFARVEVFPQLSTSAAILKAEVSIEGIKFVNMASQAYLLPRTGEGPATSVWSQSSFVGSSSGNVVSVYGDSSTPAATRYGRYYIPEHFGTVAAHTAMQIHAKYNGADTYYSIPVNGRTDAEPRQYAVERNHSYRYNVIIQGRGSSSPAALSYSGDSGMGSSEPGIKNISYELDIE